MVAGGIIVYGARIRELRKKSGKTMKEFGKIFSLAESTISGYETEARKPDIDIFQKFADYFNVSVDYLLGRTNDPSTKDDSEKGEMYFFDKENVTPDEMRDALAYIKARRMLEQKNKNKRDE